VQTGNADAQPVNPAEAAFWGFGRVAMNEYPGYRFKMIDLPSQASALETQNLASLLLAEFMHPNREDEIVLRQSGRYALRMRQLTLPAETPSAAETADMVLDFSARFAA
jgi:hypothetical protein